MDAAILMLVKSLDLNHYLVTQDYFSKALIDLKVTKRISCFSKFVFFYANDRQHLMCFAWLLDYHRQRFHRMGRCLPPSRFECLAGS